jgi:tRNA-dihydrouridine synthase A
MNKATPIVAVAPMMDWTDRHCRYLLRQISKHALLYTEMVTTGALLNGDRDRFLRHDSCEHPLALQLGGSEPRQLAECSRIGEDAGYDEINLNVGCPSDRVQSGRFGACLMAEPALVADCIMAMTQAVSVPVTVKTRIGIDDRDSYDELADFITCVQQAGCETFIIHARKAFLQGLSPKENRTVPPLNYAFAYRIKQQYPELCVVINGGITDLAAAERHLTTVDGVMLGRSAYHNPYILADVDRRLFQDTRPSPSREEVVLRMLPYIERELNQGSPLKHITRHMLGLFQGMPGARHWRRHLSQHGPRSGACIEVITQALDILAAYGNAPSTTSTDYQIHG